MPFLPGHCHGQDGWDEIFCFSSIQADLAVNRPIRVEEIETTKDKLLAS